MGTSWAGTRHCTDLFQHISQIVAPESIDIKYTSFTTDIEEDPR